MTDDVTLRDVVDADVRVFYEQQLDPNASQMAAFPSRDWSAFEAHWTKIRANDIGVLRTIDAAGQVAGNIVSWEADGKRLIGYWVGKEFWGQGIATKALTKFIAILPTRPLHAHVAKHNIGSIKVLEKCGFAVIGEERGDDGIDEFLMELTD
ncbi:MAG: hypothetical protein QOG53_2199 [Frankiales bacterium]|nr:hypothetical protein [Frankiales bacterium]